MTNITENYSPTNNFWEYNPQFLAAEPFSQMYRSDKTSNKSGSSSKMWCIALIYYPKSELYNMPNKEFAIPDAMKKSHGINIKLDELSDVIEAFIGVSLDQADQSLVSWNKRMKNRDEFLDSKTYTLDSYDDTGRLIKGSAEQLDRMAANTSKLYDEYYKVQKALAEANSRQMGRKGSVDSLADSDEL